MFVPGTLVIVAERPDRFGTSPVDVAEENPLDLVVYLYPEECRVEVVLDKRP